MLRRWESINEVIWYDQSFEVYVSSVSPSLSIFSDEGLTLETSALKRFISTVANLRYQRDNTKLRTLD